MSSITPNSLVTTRMSKMPPIFPPLILLRTMMSLQQSQRLAFMTIYGQRSESRKRSNRVVGDDSPYLLSSHAVRPSIIPPPAFLPAPVSLHWTPTLLMQRCMKTCSMRMDLRIGSCGLLHCDCVLRIFECGY